MKITKTKAGGLLNIFRFAKVRLRQGFVGAIVVRLIQEL